MNQSFTDHRAASLDAPTQPIANIRGSRPLLAPNPSGQRPPMPAERPEPIFEPVSVFDRVEPRTIGLLVSMVLGGLLLVAVALILMRGGETSTAAGPSAATGALASGSPDPASPDSAAGQFPSTEGTPSTLPGVSTTVAPPTSPSTTTAPPAAAAPTAAAPATTATTAAPSTTAPPSTEVSTSASPGSDTPSTTIDPSSTMPSTTGPSSSETTAPSTTEALPTSSVPATASTTPTTATTTVATTAGPRGDDAAVQQEVLDATNAERTANGCGPLRLDPLLNRAADGHSEDMAARNYFDHVDPENRGPGFRIDAVNYPNRGWGENIAAGYGSAAAVVQGWMDSPGHRANILNCAFDEIGIGYAETGRYWTQLFATRR